MIQVQDTSVRQSISREAIIGHDTSWKVSDLGAVQFKHTYDENLLRKIHDAAIALKEEQAHQKHLNLTFITGADRFIPEINELIHDKERLDRLSTLAGTRLEPYPLSIVSSTVTFMGPSNADNSVDWHCDGVPVTELIPLTLDDHIVGGELEICLGECEVSKALIYDGKEISSRDTFKVQHKLGYSTLAQFVNVYHRTVPISAGTRVTLVLNLRSVEKPFVDDNRMFYLAADNDDDFDWVEEMRRDVCERQLPAYQAYERKKMEVAKPATGLQSTRTMW